jgi:hypothetical protein
MHTIRQQHHQAVTDFPGILLASPCVVDLGSGVASALEHFSVEGHSQFLQLSAWCGWHIQNTRTYSKGMW